MRQLNKLVIKSKNIININQTFIALKLKELYLNKNVIFNNSNFWFNCDCETSKVCILFLLLFVACCLLFVCYLSFVCCLLFIICLLFVVCCLLFVDCCLLFVVCYLLFVICLFVCRDVHKYLKLMKVILNKF